MTTALARPTRLSMLQRYLFPLMVLLSVNVKALEVHSWLAPLVVYGLYSLLRLEVGWSERFFTFTLYACTLALYLTGFSTMEGSIFLSLLVVAPVMLVAIEVERAFTEYVLSEAGVRIRSIRRDSLLPRITTLEVPYYMISGARTRYPLLSRIFKKRYIDLVLETSYGSIALRGVPQESNLPALVEKLSHRPGVGFAKYGERTGVSLVGKGLEVSGIFNPSLAGTELAELRRPPESFSERRRAGSSMSSLAGSGKESAERGESPARAKTASPPRRRVRNRIERLL
ncbi:hypothetical protein IG193_08260 [Infirmifilum lucidum]|uniref:Uncharacterized protein n=1 Tax=Infirmifilum lucidum TaxID=2776706 RepID=A0A7L9FFY7_9CREN|nr:hypothetical protein [Infirmifilum lucidum]QOJ78728.1 hypothetical protein IG193_08260 [Infirmifilum lucidum]